MSCKKFVLNARTAANPLFYADIGGKVYVNATDWVIGRCAAGQPYPFQAADSVMVRQGQLRSSLIRAMDLASK